MRRIIGMTQPEYAKFVNVAPRIIIDLERGIGNPTCQTLQKLASGTKGNLLGNKQITIRRHLDVVM